MGIYVCYWPFKGYSVLVFLRDLDRFCGTMQYGCNREI